MVTILKHQGFRVVIYTNDHSPPHVHVLRGGGEAVINLRPQGRVELREADGLSKADIRKALELVSSRHGEFLKEWRKIHG